MTVDTWIAVAAIIAVATITPGPNNLIVLEAGVRGGWREGLPLITAVIAGGLLLLTLVWAGAGLLFAAEPRLRTLLALAGSAYLFRLGAALLLPPAQAEAGTEVRTPSPTSPRSWAGVVLFQLVNPKAWVLMLTATAVVERSGWEGMIGLAALFAMLSASSLVIWTVAGSVLAAVLDQPCRRRWLDRGMGAVLIGSAAAVLGVW